MKGVAPKGVATGSLSTRPLQLECRGAVEFSTNTVVVSVDAVFKAPPHCRVSLIITGFFGSRQGRDWLPAFFFFKKYLICVPVGTCVGAHVPHST